MTAAKITATNTAADVRLWSLLAGNFIIGTGILLPTGMLGPMAADLHVTIPQAGGLMLAGGITIGLGAPVFAALTSGIDRRLLLVASLVLYLAGHVASALAPSFAVLLTVRVFTVVAAGIFTPQAAASVGLLVSPEQRAAGVAFIFLGWSVSLVAGTAIASLIANYLGWRVAYLILAALCVPVLIWVAASIPKGLKAVPLSLSSWGAVFTSPALLLVLLVTAASSSGQFTMLTYLQPMLRDQFAAGPGAIALVLAVFGIVGIFGNAIAARIVVAWGVGPLISVLLVSMLAGFVIFGLANGSLLIAALGVAAWGLGTFSSNSLQQARLIGMAPPLAAASVALNTSAIYLGQAVGPAIGGILIGASMPGALAWAAAGLVALAFAMSLMAERMRERV